MKYLMLVCVDESLVLPPEDAAVSDCPGQWAEVAGRNVWLSGSQLQGVSDATTVRVRDSEVLIADGPFTETKEQIAGFDVIECADLDEAIEVASKHPVARHGVLELRPFRQG
ncbi:YciI family protein [Micromonospora sp. DT43]|uniref:YciI family protein n=1 Tax=Micromonospora sp. DT43 TaxID=3393440 RepID=UPI003CEC8EB6